MEIFLPLNFIRDGQSQAPQAKNQVVKQERAEQRIDDEVQATESALKESKKPEVQKEGFSKKILPIVAICGIVFLMIKKF